MIANDLFALDDSSCCSTDSEESEYDSLDACLDAFSLAEYIRSQGNCNKRQRTGHVPEDLRPLAFVRFNTRLGKAKPITIKALLDSGASELLIAMKHTKNLRVKTVNAKGTVWSTPAGELKTNHRVKSQFTIPELQDKKLIEWNLHVAEDMGTYDMIIGKDILSFL